MNLYHDATANRALQTAGFDKFRKIVAAAWTRFAERLTENRRRERDYQRLLEMPDYLLEDIGLTRGDVHAARQRHGVFPSHPY